MDNVAFGWFFAEFSGWNYRITGSRSSLPQ